MAQNDPFESRFTELTSPAKNGFAITPHDTNNLTADTRAIYVGGAGNIALVTSAGDEITLNGALAGTIIPIRATKVKSTGTTATNLVGLY